MPSTHSEATILCDDERQVTLRTRRRPPGPSTGPCGVWDWAWKLRCMLEKGYAKASFMGGEEEEEEERRRGIDIVVTEEGMLEGKKEGRWDNSFCNTLHMEYVY